MEIIIGILFMAVTVAFLIGWGIIKKQKKQEELFYKLLNKCEKKILNRFKNKSSLSKKEIERVIEGTKASLFWSKEKAEIKDPRLLSETIINFLVRRSLIKEKSKNKYELVKRG
ncbi:MAG: hypothetical protein FH753_00020 [Firmicutes bacterium]|nr:hypothetical protein [Bacillota bacterium]